MTEEHKLGLQQSIFHGVKNSIHTRGNFTFKKQNVFVNPLEQTSINDTERLKSRLFNQIMIHNNARARKYPNANIKPIYSNTPFKIGTFATADDSGKNYAGSYTLFPMEFICQNCGRIYSAEKGYDPSSIPSKCECGGKLDQNTIVLFCEKCGKISSLDCFCKIPGHGKKYAYLSRPQLDDLNTWRTGCKKCMQETGRSDVDVFCFPCSCPDKGKRRALTVREGGIYSPVSMTFVDIDGSIKGDDSDYLQLAIETELITKTTLLEMIGNQKLASYDLPSIVKQVRDAGDLPLTADYYIKANQYIDQAITQVKKNYEGVELEQLNDSRFIDRVSESFDNYINKLTEKERLPLSLWYSQSKEKYGLSDIRYVKELKVIMSSIGQIVGINKFYEDDFVPHFEPFKEKRDSDGVYAMVVPTITEGIMFKLDPIKVCKWLKKNGFSDEDIDTVSDANRHLSHIKTKSEEEIALKTLIHTISHIMIKQSTIYTGLDENTCAELLFPTGASFLIYSTSSVNIGGFEYAFNYSLPNWFSRVDEAAEDCTFDPTCMKEGGKCFSCLYVSEFVCCNFNKELSRQTLIGNGHMKTPGEYCYGYWK